MNVLLSIGCDRYQFLPPLSGAEKDACSIFEVLSVGEFYDLDRSELLKSPSRIEMESALARILRGGSIDVFTFFYAGHADGKEGSFYLTNPETEMDALSFTSFPLSRLFEVVNEFKPRQINVIIDGCGAGGSIKDIQTLLRPESVGAVNASSVAFLGGCAAEELAGETPAGGTLTTQLLRTVRGETSLELFSPMIDLTEVSAAVSEAVTREHPDQHPIFWALSLFGRGGFVRNPKMHIPSPIPSLSLDSVSPGSTMETRLSEFAGELWDEYRLASSSFDSARLGRLLRKLLAPDDLEISDRLAAVSGILRSFSAVARIDGELLTRHFCMATCLVSLLPWSDHADVRAFVKTELRFDFVQTNALLSGLCEEIKINNSKLCTDSGILSDLYYGPMRLTRLLGLVGTQSIIGGLLGFETDDSKLNQTEIITTLIDSYCSFFVALDDEQAAPLYLFFKAAARAGWHEAGIQYLESLYADAADRKGVFNRLGSDGRGALEYLLASIGSEHMKDKNAPANPSTLLPVILLGGVWLGCSQEWDLQAFDRRNLGVYVPEDYGTFAQEVICRGMTHTMQIGFGVWTVKEFSAEFDLICRNLGNASGLSDESHCLCMLAAMLAPNRIPYNLEAVGSL